MKHHDVEHDDTNIKALVESINNAEDLQIVIDFGKKVIETTKDNDLAPRCYNELLSAVFKKIEKLTYELRISQI